MQLLGLLAPLLLLVSLAGFVWLLVVAFRHSVGWGLLVLFLSPITALIFAVKNWEESRRPFLLYVGSGAASLAVMFAALAWFAGSAAVAMSDSVAEMDAEAVMASTHAIEPGAEPPGAPDETNAAPAAATAGGLEPMPLVGTQDGSQAMPPSLATDVSEEERAALHDLLEGQEEISITEARQHVGELLRVTERGGLEHVGTLAEVTERSLVLERSIAYGSFSFEIPQRDITTIEIVAYP